MKRLLTILSVLSLASCQDSCKPDNPSECVHTLSFLSSLPTKTSLEPEGLNVVYNWNLSDADTSRFFISESDGSAAAVPGRVDAVSLDGRIMNIEASFQGPRPAQATFNCRFNRAVRPSQLTMGGQYDQDSDVLVSEPLEASSEDMQEGKLAFRFKRLVAFSEVTLNGLDAAGCSKVSGLVVESLGKSPQMLSGVLSDSEDFTATGNRLYIDCDSPIEDGSARVRFVSLPVENAPLRISVIASDADGAYETSYVKSFAEGKSISLPQGDLTEFRMGFSTAASASSSVVFDLTQNCCSYESPQKVIWSSPAVKMSVLKGKSGMAANNWLAGKNGNNTTRLYTKQNLRIEPARGAKVDSVFLKVNTQNMVTILVNKSNLNGAVIEDRTENSRYAVKIVPGEGSEHIDIVPDGGGEITLTSAEIFFSRSENRGTEPQSGISVSGSLELPSLETGAQEYVKTYFVGDQRNYTCNFDYETYASLWVAYPLWEGTIGGSRDDAWAKEPQLDLEHQINIWSSGYGVNLGQTTSEGFTTRNNYYARGHQIPSADRNGIKDFELQTYYSINSTPQIQNSFNSGIWSSLEKAVRGMIPPEDTLYVVTGPAFDKPGENKPVTVIYPANDPEKGVPVPNYYWKALLKVGRGEDGGIVSAKTIGFWIEHIEQKGKSYTEFTVSVDQIEQWTGLDLFVNLPSSFSDAEANDKLDTFITEFK